MTTTLALLTVLLGLLDDRGIGFRPAIPSTGNLVVSVQAEIPYSLSYENGFMVVDLGMAPAGTFAIEARRKVQGREVVIGRSATICRCAPGPLEVAVWPVGGRVLKVGDYPVIVFGDGAEDEEGADGEGGEGGED